MILKQLAHLIKLDISGCDVTDQGAEMITEVLLKTTSLKEFSIANAKLTTAVAIKILTALEKICSLQMLKLNNNDIEDEAANGIANVISNNHLLQKLNISCNKFSASGLFPIIQTLSVSTNMKLLDISSNFKNYSSPDEREYLGITLPNCYTLQELNISNNFLTFTDVLKIAQAFRSHPTLQILNMSNNIISYFLECEFLMDLILSTNHVLANVNVCDRNIRPRFNDDCLFFPRNCDENSNRFMLQNLYISQYALLNRITPANTVGIPGIHTDYIVAKEKCPVSCQSIISYYVDYSGGVFYNQEHDFAIVIPPNAVSQGESVQIQATASRFSQCKLPDGYHPISSHFWFSACYTFKLPVYLIMSHYAKIENLKDIDNLCVLHAYDHDLSSEEEPVMQVVSSGVYFDYEISYCVFATDHFCSICLGKNNTHIPGKFVSFLYTNDTDREYFAEVCFCPAIGDCIKVIMCQPAILLAYVASFPII